MGVYQKFWLWMCIAAFLLVSCTKLQRLQKVEPASYEIASKTKRGHIVTESIIILNGYNFTIQYVNANQNYAALQTYWRDGEKIPFIKKDDTFLFRDRAVLHFSPRHSDAARTYVSSSIHFEMQRYDEFDETWFDAKPDSMLQAQYKSIAVNIKDRLRKKGYIFN